MKKAILAVAVLIMLAATLFGCGKDAVDESTTYDYDSVLTETSVPLDIGSVIMG